MDDVSAETVTAGLTLGLQHPPGYSLDALLTRLASLAPMGNHCFGINLLSAFLASLAVSLLSINILFLLKIFDNHQKSTPGKWFLIFCSSSGALLLAFSRTFWEKALGAKGSIYLLQSLILLAVLHCLIRSESTPFGKPGKGGPGFLEMGSLGIFYFRAWFNQSLGNTSCFFAFFVFFLGTGQKRKNNLPTPPIKMVGYFFKPWRARSVPFALFAVTRPPSSHIEPRRSRHIFKFHRRFLPEIRLRTGIKPSNNFNPIP